MCHKHLSNQSEKCIRDEKNENLLKYGERTFVGINGAVNPITFWKLIVAFSCVMALHNSTNSIEFCAIS